MNQDFCSLIIANTGLPVCDVKLGKPIALYFAGKSVEITPADTNNLLTFFQSKTQEDDFSKRIIPVSGIKQLDDGYAEPTTGTLSGYGYSEQLSDGTLTSTFHFISSLCRAKAMIGLNGYTGRVFVLLDNGILVGTRLSNGNIIGLPIESLGAKFAGGIFGDGQNVKTVQMTLTFGSDKQVIKGMTAIKYDFDVADVTGLQNVILFNVKGSTFKVLTECEGVDLYDDYHLSLTNTKVWRIWNTETGNEVPAISVSPDPEFGGGSFSINFGITPGITYGVQLRSVSTLVEHGIIGFENTKPGFAKDL